ncbi:M55 family metallopeptidase [Pseudothermotoga elfii]
MKIYISVDMEGLAGISMWQEVDPGNKQSIDLLQEHLKAVLDGLFDSGADISEVVISDSHSRGDNIPYGITKQYDRVKIVHGSLRKDFMMSGLNESFDRVFFIGYHAGIGCQNGIMDHTYSSSLVHNIWINGKRMNEAVINAAFAGYHGVPVALIVGDEMLKRELKDLFMGKYEYVVTKEGISRYAAIMKPITSVMSEIKQAVKKAVEIEKHQLPLINFANPVELRVEFKDTSYADAVELMPGVERIDGRTVSLSHDQYPVVFNALMAMIYIASSIRNAR